MTDTLKQLAIEKEKAGGSIPLEDIINASKENPAFKVLKEMPTEWIKGELLGLAGKSSGVVADKLGGGTLAKVAGEATALPIETATLVGANRVLDGTPITTDNIIETGLTIGLLKGSGAFPGAVKDAITFAVKEKGLPAEKIVENLKNEKAETLNDPDAGTEAVNRAVVKTELQLQAEKDAAIQREIINKQLKSNYKEGKPAEEIIQINQIPAELRSYVLDETPEGFKIKDEVLNTVREIIDPNNNIFKSSFPFKDEGAELYNKYNQLRDQYKTVNDEYKQFKDNADTVHKEHYDSKINELITPELKYTKYPATRALIDNLLDKGNTLTPEAKTEIVHKPETVSKYFAEYQTLPEKVQKTVTTEMVNSFAKELNVTPPHLHVEATKYADKQLANKIKDYETQLESIKTNGINVTRHPDFQDYKIRIEEDAKTNEQKQAEIKNALKPALKEYAKEIAKSKEYYQSEILKVLGTSPEYKNVSYNPKEVYGELHLQDTLDFYRTTQEKAEAILNKANLLTTEHGHLLDANNFRSNLFTNASRVIKNKLGEPVYKLFVQPLRQAEHNVLIEQIKQKEWIKAFKKGDKELKNGFSKEESIEIGVHLTAQQEQGLETIKAMNEQMINAKLKDMKVKNEDYVKMSPEQRQAIRDDAAFALKDKLIKPKTYDELSPKAQEAVTKIRELLKVTLDRINTGRKLAGLDPIEGVDNYFTFIRKFSKMEGLGFNLFAKDASWFNADTITDLPSKSSAFRFIKDRVESTRALEFDAFHVLETYMGEAIKTIHMTPVIGTLRKMIDSAAEFRVQNKYAYDYMSGTLDYVAGKKLADTKVIVNKFANIMNKNIASFTLAWNIKSALTQPFSLIGTVATLSPKYVAKGLKDFMNPHMRDFAMKSSKHLKGRAQDVAYADARNNLEYTHEFNPVANAAINTTTFASNVIGAVTKPLTHYGMKPLEYFDLKTAQVAWLSGFRYGKEHLKLSDREAILFADDAVVHTQGSASRIDLAPIQRTPVGKSLTLFNTFVINNINMLAEDVTGLKTKKELVKDHISKAESELYYDPKYTKVMMNDSTYNIYETKKMLSSKEGMHNVMNFIVASAVAGTIAEVLGLDNPPVPEPVAAFYEAMASQNWVDAMKGNRPTKKEGQLIDGIMGSIGELTSLIPVVGGAPRYGGDSAFGAAAGKIVELFNSIAGKPGAKPLAYHLGWLNGIPSGQQIYKYVKQLDREERQRVDTLRHQRNPGYYIKKEIRDANPEYYKQKKELKKQIRGY